MKVWKETWEATWDSDYSVTLRRDAPDGKALVGSISAGRPDGFARARLAAAAPDLARALLEVEWQWRERSEYRRCPSCHGDETTEGEPRTGHADDCALDAALRKAGVR